MSKMIKDGGKMSQYYVPEDDEIYIKWHIPFTGYFLYRNPNTKLWYVVEKELSINHEKPYAYRFL